MTIMKYLLVCEGPTDIEILDAIAKGIANKNGHTIEIVALSPQLDATSGTYPSHGWTAVRTWCKTNRAKTAADVAALDPLLRPVALRKNWKTLVAASGASGIIIQLDTDIAELIVDLPVIFANAGVSRRDYCNAAIASWLNVPKVEAGMFLILSTYSTETWLLACHDVNDPVFSDIPGPFNFEDIQDIEIRLMALGYKRKSGRLSKKPQLYKRYAQDLINNLVKVRAECVEADNCCKFFENA